MCSIKPLVRILALFLLTAFSAISAAQTTASGDFLNLSMTGNKKFLFILVKYPGDHSGSISISDAKEQADVLKETLERNSYGRLRVEVDVTPVLALPQPAGYYEKEPVFTRIRDDALVLARQAGFDVDDYDREVYFTKKVWTGTNAIALNERVAFVSRGNGYLVAHEIGHTFGWGHANFWQVKQGSPISRDGVEIEYGDPYDIMGDGTTGKSRSFHNFNPWFKSRAGWIPAASMPTVTQSGTYVLQPLEAVPDASARKFTCLRIPRDPDTDYWVFYRSQEEHVDYGATITWGYRSNIFPSRLLDMTPGSKSNDWEDAALAPGETFTDAGAGISLRVLSVSANEVKVEVTLSRGAIDKVPVINVLRPERGTIASGTVAYEVSAFDPDYGTANGDGIQKVEVFLVQGTNDDTILNIWAKKAGSNSQGVLTSWQLSSPPYKWSFNTKTDFIRRDGIYAMAIRATSRDGNSNTIVLKQVIDNTGPSIPTAVVEPELTLPQSFQLAQNYPNPFNPETEIRFTLPTPGFVQLEIYNAIGQRVETLVDGFRPAGVHRISWRPASQFAGGVYFYQLRVFASTPALGHVGRQLFSQTRKLVLLK